MRRREKALLQQLIASRLPRVRHAEKTEIVAEPCAGRAINTCTTIGCVVPSS